MTSKRDYALRLARHRQLRVFPIKQGEHTPLVKFSQLATTDEDKINHWWTEKSKRNIGVHTGNGYFVLDVDTQNNGDDSLAALESKHTPLPSTYTVATPSGGAHFYFASNADVRNSASKIGPGLDIRGHNGYVVAEGSERKKGDKPAGIYECIDNSPITKPPDWLLDLALADRQAEDPRIDDEPQQDIPPGQRNNRLFKEGCALRAKGWSARAIAEALEIRNRDFSAPLPHEEVLTIARQCAKYDYDKAAHAYDGFIHAQQTTDDAFKKINGAESYVLSDHPSERIEYLWRGLFPRKAVTLLAGDAGRAKTTFMLSIAAAVSTGKPPFDDNEDGSTLPRGSVMLVTAEDSIKQTIVPRLTAAGADLDRVYAIAVREDLGLIDRKARRKLIESWRAIPDLELVVLDPITAFMSDQHDNNAPSHVRLYVGAMTDIAEELNVSVVGITHLNKDQSKHVSSRILGSTAWTAAARAVYVIGPDPEEKEKSIMVCLKTNFRTPEPIGFTLGFKDVLLSDGTTDTYTHVIPELYDGEASLEDIFKSKPRQISKRQQAEAFMLSLLEGKGWVPVQYIRREVHRQNVCSWSYIKQKIKPDLLIQTRRSGKKGEVGGGRWEWRIPDAGPMPDVKDSGKPEDGNTVH
jgi:hypothetical protein